MLLDIGGHLNCFAGKKEKRVQTRYIVSWHCGFFSYFAEPGSVLLSCCNRLELAVCRFVPKERTVSLMSRRPNRSASRVLGVHMSIRLPRTAPPVSATIYSPLNDPASRRTLVPRGNTAGSAAIKPRLTGRPLAVRPRRL